MGCIGEAFKLFGTHSCEATVIAVTAFLVGMIVMCLVCKLFCKPCGKKCGTAQPKKGDVRKPAEKKGEEKPFEKRKPHPAPADGSVEIYVGNLSYDMTEDQLRKTFEAFGTVSNVRLVINHFNGKSKGFGFVQMPNRSEAEKACEGLNDHEIMGRKIKCNEAKNLI